MSVIDALQPFAEAVGERIGHEIGIVRSELERPWRDGRSEPAARTGRWIGLGLAVGAALVGLAAALRVERPWE